MGLELGTPGFRDPRSYPLGHRAPLLLIYYLKVIEFYHKYSDAQCEKVYVEDKKLHDHVLAKDACVVEVVVDGDVIVEAGGMRLERERRESEADQLSGISDYVPRTVHAVGVLIGMVGGGEGA